MLTRTVKELGRDRDMRRYVPVGGLLAPQPKVSDNTLSRRRSASPSEECISLYVYMYHVFGDALWYFRGRQVSTTSWTTTGSTSIGNR